MSRTKYFVKYFKNIVNSINSLLEKNLNKLNFNNLRNLLINNKLILTFVALLVLFVSYLILPVFYNKADISRELEAKLLSHLDLNFKISNNLNYNIFPTPHFNILDTSIIYENQKISQINNLKIFISLENLFSLKKTNIKKVAIENANFNFNKINYNFFIKILDSEFSLVKLKIKNSNIFFRNNDNEVLFINKIKNMKYYYDLKELKNILHSENEIFNIPYSIKISKSKDNEKILSKVNINLFKIQMQNELSYIGTNKIGKLNIIHNKLKREITYETNKNYFKFNFYDKLDNSNFFYKGFLNFNPFYSSFIGKTEELNLSYFLNKNSLITQVLKTEVLNNKNLDFILNIYAKNIYKNPNFSNLNLNSKIKEGLLDLDNSKFKWKDFADFELLDSLIYIKDGEVVLDGKLNIKINNINKIYKFLLTPKNNRKNLNQIELRFSYNFDQKITNLNDIKVDNIYNEKLNELLKNIIFRENNLQNKIYLKKILNNAIKSYSG